MLHKEYFWPSLIVIALLAVLLSFFGGNFRGQTFGVFPTVGIAPAVQMMQVPQPQVGQFPAPQAMQQQQAYAQPQIFINSPTGTPSFAAYQQQAPAQQQNGGYAQGAPSYDPNQGVDPGMYQAPDGSVAPSLAAEQAVTSGFQMSPTVTAQILNICYCRNSAGILLFSNPQLTSQQFNINNAQFVPRTGTSCGGFNDQGNVEPGTAECSTFIAPLSQ